METGTIAGAAHDQLKSFVERIEHLEEEKAALAADITELFAQAKSIGFDTKALREVLKLRKMDANEREEREGAVATYMHALGMVPPVSSEKFAELPRNDTAPRKAA